VVLILFCVWFFALWGEKTIHRELKLPASESPVFNSVRFCRATRGKTAHKEIGTYLAAAGKNVAL
jgi:hypothetical protein